MSFNGSGLGGHRPTCSAMASCVAAFIGVRVCVLFGKLMTALAMCKGFPFFRRRGDAQCEAGNISVSFLRKNLLRRPPPRHSFENHSRRYAESFRPHGDGLCRTIMRDPRVVSSVIVLLSFCRPAAVFRTIVSIIIYTVNAVTIWARPHIVPEGKEVFRPTRTYFYASRAVMFICRACWRPTAKPHLKPNIVDWCAALAVALSHTVYVNHRKECVNNV